MAAGRSTCSWIWDGWCFSVVKPASSLSNCLFLEYFAFLQLFCSHCSRRELLHSGRLDGHNSHLLKSFFLFEMDFHGNNLSLAELTSFACALLTSEQVITCHPLTPWITHGDKSYQMLPPDPLLGPTVQCGNCVTLKLSVFGFIRAILDISTPDDRWSLYLCPLQNPNRNLLNK